MRKVDRRPTEVSATTQRRLADFQESSSTTKYRQMSRCDSGQRAPGNDVATRDQGFAEA